MLGKRLGVADVEPDDLIAAMGSLGERQDAIQRRLAKRWIAEGSLVLFDLTSTHFEGACFSLAKCGYSRDKQGEMLRIKFDPLCDADSGIMAAGREAISWQGNSLYVPSSLRFRDWQLASRLQ